MLHQICQHGRLIGCLHDSSSNPLSLTSTKTLSDILLQTAGIQEDPGACLKIVPPDVYGAILSYLNFQTLFPFRHAQALPHPDNARVLPRTAISVRHFKHKGRDYSTVDMHPGNSSVHFLAQGRAITADSGHIEVIWRYKIDRILCTFVMVSAHQNLSPQDETRDPYVSYTGFLAKLVYARQTNNLSLVILEQDQIVSHAAYYTRPAGTFGIRHSTSVLINSLHRYRSS
jgi:hypothetical protein